MERQAQYQQKNLKLTYQDYVNRGKTLQNLIIDNYIVYNRIGEGSNGQVYKGMDDRTKKNVAIKLMDIKSINEERSNAVRAIKQRLCESEPRLMYQCNSPHLIKCFDVYRNDDLKVLVLQYCNGSTLQKEIDEKRRIPEKQAIQITKHLINGLMELHKHKIIHRDLKAENIMNHNGTYKIIDFGFSKKLQIAQENAEIKGTSLGTITTMAPEVMSKRPYGLKADIWSLGVIYFQMIYGVYPYDSLTAATLYQEIKAKKIFDKPNPLTINGFTPSKQSFDFIKSVIVFETSERPSWRQLFEHPLIKNKNNDEITQRFIQKTDVVVDPKLQEWEEPKQSLPSNTLTENEDNISLRKIEEFKLKQNKIEEENKQKIKKQQAQLKLKLEQKAKQQEKAKTKIEEKPKFKINLPTNEKKEQEDFQRFRYEQYQRQRKEQQQKQAKLRQIKARQEQKIIKISNGERKMTESVNVREIPKEEVRNKLNQENQEEREQFQFTQRAHLECLKTQFIYRQIINPLYTTQYLPANDRSTIEFLYLLLARCFNNMSPIQYELENRHKNKDMIMNLNEQITPLYNQVRSKFLEFSDKLTQAENKMTSIIGDFFKKRIDKSNFSQKDNFLTGIQIINYSKEQQISFTYRYYTANIQKKIESVNNLSNVFKRLNKYLQVNRLTREQLVAQKKDFSTAVKDIIG